METRETSRSTNTRREPRTRDVLVNGRLPPSAAESVLRVQSTLATNPGSRRAFAGHFVARRARLCTAALARRAKSAKITPEITPDPTRAFDATVRPRPRIRLFAAGKISRLTGSAISAVGSGRRARAHRETNARGTRRALVSRGSRTRPSADRASRAVPRVSRRARAAQRRTAALTCHVR